MAMHAASPPDPPDDLGREARTPGQIPAQGWKQVLGRVRRRISQNSLGLIAAGVAFYSLLAVFPGIAALISVYGLVADPAQVGEQFAALRNLLPAEAYSLLYEQMRQVAAHSGRALGVGLIGSILLAMWSATKGTRSLIIALNIAYDERERRGFLHLNALAFGMTLFLVLQAVVVIALIVALPMLLGYFGLGSIAQTMVNGLRWPLLAGMALLTLALIYRYGPCRRQARWRWVSWGSAAAVCLWLVVSALFSLYVANFGSYDATYGSVGAVVVLLMWLYLTAFVMILGASVNAEMERQTARDTTYRGEQPRGQRGAWVADHLPGER